LHNLDSKTSMKMHSVWRKPWHA